MNAHSERYVRPRCKVSGCEFSTKSDIAVLIRTGTAPGDIHVAGCLSQTSCLLHPDFDKCAPHIENLWGFIEKNDDCAPHIKDQRGFIDPKL